MIQPETIQPEADTAALPIACCPGSLVHPFSRVLAMQREEEPETPARLIDTGFLDQASGLEEGRYGVGLSLEEHASPALASMPLWSDEIAVALPAGSPLLALEEIPLEELVRHPLVLWSPASPETLAVRTNALLCTARRPLNMAQQVQTFGMLAVLVAAGFGAALAAKSQIVAWQSSGIAMRPLAGPPQVLTTYLVYPAAGRSDAVERFIERVRRCRSGSAVEQPA
ncbi:LysR substrate-binding domain-containing protein [Aquamicrobium lusatiense]|uniref:LysR substrate-binding domain-containing protein n=1 Tax=Aquamicrobium lusatiense TaxID=89772 RepID=UPI0024537AEF|nr:LysR substrate-binding domain-containing protein [Aquamicrobium lusatiense]MDH4990695.1 LysR substrate-binding domain-containing protein [Aquamicrobium lusatiense]